jgi:hypothetical protein
MMNSKLLTKKVSPALSHQFSPSLMLEPLGEIVSPPESPPVPAPPVPPQPTPPIPSPVPAPVPPSPEPPVPTPIPPQVRHLFDRIR